MGDELIVSITQDEYVNKGPGRPVFNHYKRAAVINSLRIVDRSILCKDALEALKLIVPDIFVKGEEYRGKIGKEDEDFCKSHGIEIKFTPGERFSSTELLHYYCHRIRTKNRPYVRKRN